MGLVLLQGVLHVRGEQTPDCRRRQLKQQEWVSRGKVFVMEILASSSELFCVCDGLSKPWSDRVATLVRIEGRTKGKALENKTFHKARPTSVLGKAYLAFNYLVSNVCLKDILG